MKAFPSKRPVIKNLGKFGPIEFKPIIEDGMDLRDYFAAKAMQGLLATTKEEQWFPDEVAGISYEVADAMIKARGINE